MGVTLRVGGNYRIDMSYDGLLGGTELGTADIASFTSTKVVGYTFYTKVTIIGHGFTPNSAGYVVDGTLTGVIVEEGSKVVTSLSGLNLPVPSLVNAWLTYPTWDERALERAQLAGADALHGGRLADFIVGHDGDDGLFGKNGDDVLNGGNGNDTLIGGAGDDRLVGALGDDELLGGNGADKLKGGVGNDRLEGGLGKDMLKGEGDADIFAFRSVADSKFKQQGWDVIQDFNRGEGDRIDLSAIDARTGKKNQAFTFIGQAAFTGTKGELRVETKAGKTFIYGDVDGDAVADLAIKLDGTIALQESDLVL